MGKCGRDTVASRSAVHGNVSLLAFIGADIGPFGRGARNGPIASPPRDRSFVVEDVRISRLIAAENDKRSADQEHGPADAWINRPAAGAAHLFG